MFYSSDPLDGFKALFGDGTVVFPKRSLPLGACVVDFMNLDPADLDRLGDAADTLLSEMNAYLCGDPDATQAALTSQALKAFFSLLYRLPVYRELEQDIPRLSVFRQHPHLWERTVTAGTEEYTETQRWMKNARELRDSVYWFQQRTEALLDRAFAGITERSASAYAERLGRYYAHVTAEIDALDDRLEYELAEGGDYDRLRSEFERDIDRGFIPMYFPIRVRYRTVPHPGKEGAFLLAEEVLFPDLATFLSLDLLRGFATGHLPRRCEHCGRWFLLENGYDTRYCENPAPEEPDKTCRQIGAHRKETRLNGTDEIRAEYKRVTNRLKGRKFRGSLTAEEWNNWMRIVQDLRDDTIAGRIKLSELRERYDGICNHREK